MATIYRGVGVAPGVAVGRCRPWHVPTEPSVRDTVAVGSPDEELARFGAARRAAQQELSTLKARVTTSLGANYAEILDAQALMVNDPVLEQEVERRIRERGIGARAAVNEAIDAHAARLAAANDHYLKERAGDLDDVKRRLLRLLDPDPAAQAAQPGGPIVVVAQHIGPSDTVALVQEGVVGIAADLGGPTSHTAILAKAFGLPAVVGLGNVARRVRAGATVIVDGDQGELIVDPDDAGETAARARHDAWWARGEQAEAGRDLPAVTRDGVEIVIRANIEFVEEAGSAARFGAHGIGLYRSEFLFLAKAPLFPDEEDHFRTYRDLASRAGGAPVTVRTLDLGGEKYFHEMLDAQETHPALGLRGLRLCLKRPDLFVPQLRALLRAAASADIRILLPMVTSIQEIREVRTILAREAAALRAAGQACRADVPLGAMIETPAAAMTADHLAREVDFLSIGTNDLIQYALAVDRGNPAVASLYEPLHPAVARMIRFAVRSARAASVPISLCGEMAAAPDLVPAVLALGLRELSVPPRAVPRVREAIRGTDIAGARGAIEDDPA